MPLRPKGTVTRGIQHHLHDALDVPVCGLERADVDAEAARDG